MREVIPSHVNHVWQRHVDPDTELPIPEHYYTLCGYEWEGGYWPQQVFYYEDNDLCPRCRWKMSPKLRGEKPDDSSTWGD